MFYRLLLGGDLLLLEDLHSVELILIDATNLLHEVDSAVGSGSKQLQDLKVRRVDLVQRVKGV